MIADTFALRWDLAPDSKGAEEEPFEATAFSLSPFLALSIPRERDREREKREREREERERERERQKEWNE